MSLNFLTDTCTITSAPSVAFDSNAGYDVETAGDEVYSGVCQVRPLGADQVLLVGEGTASINSKIVRLPWDVTDVRLHHIVTVDASSDPYMVGRTLRVTGIQGGTDSATRNLFCEDTETEDVEEVGS